MINIKSVEDFKVDYKANPLSRYTFTNNGFMYGGMVWAQNYDVDNGRAHDFRTAYCYASLFDENGNEVYVLCNNSGHGSAGTQTKIFIPIKKGWYMKINSATYGGSGGLCYGTGTAIYTYDE